MNYKEQLNEFRKTKLNFLNLEVANEVDYQLNDYYNAETDECIEIAYDDKEFEELCSLCEYVYLDIDNIPLYQIAKSVVDLFYKNHTTDFSRYEIVDNINFN